MKRIIAICCAVLLATACVEPIQPYTGPVVNKPEDGTPVTLTFSLPPVTKGTMGRTPDISTLHVAVFNQAGVLKQYEQATLDKPAGAVLTGEHANNPTYSVTVNMSATKRILHFIADSPVTTFDALVALAGTSGEDAILNALTTSNGKAAYWQRVELDKIDAYTYQGGIYRQYGEEGATSYDYYNETGQKITVNVGDYIKRDGKKVLDGTGYFQSDYVKEKIANIPLVRNFAEITVTDNPSSNFHPVKFALVNVPAAGYVAPFDTKKRAFAEAYIGKESLVHSDVAATQYPGSLVGDINTDEPTTFINVGTAAYMYERPLPNTQQPSTCLLVAGTYNVPGAKTDENGHTWFKIEISNDKNQYFPIYRGLSYDVKIGTIDGSLGYGSATDAYNDYPLGDISHSTSTATLESINDGKGTTLRVEYVDYVATQAETKTLYYTMYSQTGSTTTYLFDDVELKVSHKYGDSRAAIDGDVTIEDGEFQSGTPDDSKKWKRATVNLAGVGQSTKYSTLTVTGTTPEEVGARQMSREVNYEVMGVRQFQSLSATSLTSEAIGEITELSIGLPSDLGFSLFPLQLMIEPQNENYASTGGLPVEYGSSLFVEDAKSEFYFVMTIEYDMYLNRVEELGVPVFKAYFKTTRDGSTGESNATTFAVRDKVKPGRTTPYFEKAECEVTIGGPIFDFSKHTQAVSYASTEVHFHVRSSTDGTWTLHCDNPDVEISPDHGTGDQVIAVSFPENTSETDVNTYTITGSLDGFDDAELVITQNHIAVMQETTATIPVNSATFNENYVYHGAEQNTIHMNFDGGDNRQTNYVALDRNRTCGLLVSAANIKKIVIRWTGNSYRSRGSYVSHIHGETTRLTDGTTNPYTTTWEGNADAVSIKFANGTNNYRINQIEVTYDYEL